MPNGFTLDDHPGLAGPMGPLFEVLQKRILALSQEVSMSVYKGYIAFVSSNHFTDVLPRKRSLKVLLCAARGMIDDPQGRCKDISGTFGPFEYEFSVTSAEDLDYAMLLVEQALALDKRR